MNATSVIRVRFEHLSVHYYFNEIIAIIINNLGAAEYTDCISVEGYCYLNEWPGQNNLIMKFQ